MPGITQSPTPPATPEIVAKLRQQIRLLSVIELPAPTDQQADRTCARCSMSESTRIILAAHDDSRLNVISSAACRFEQDIDGPVYLVIRENATDCALVRAASMFSIAVEKLVKFRDSLRAGCAA